jgi:hypothetical protein
MNEINIRIRKPAYERLRKQAFKEKKSIKDWSTTSVCLVANVIYDNLIKNEPKPQIIINSNEAVYTVGTDRIDPVPLLRVPREAFPTIIEGASRHCASGHASGHPEAGSAQLDRICS